MNNKLKGLVFGLTYATNISDIQSRLQAKHETINGKKKRVCVGWKGEREMGYLIQAFPFCHGVAEIFLVFRLFLFVIFRNSSFLVLLPHFQTKKGKKCCLQKK